MATDFRIGGRIVWSGGNKPLEAYQQKDVNTKLPKVKKDGTPRMVRSFGLAIPSADFLAVIWPIMYAEAQRYFPHGQFPQNFAWKYRDSNTYDKGDPAKGVPPKLYSEREGYAGCHVLSVQSEYNDPTSVVIWQNNSWVQVPWDSLKTGDYIELSGSIDAHNEATPGLYVNPKGIQLTLVGNAITGGGFDPTAAFGNGPAQAPAGAVGQAPTAGAHVPATPPPPNAPAPTTPPAPGQPNAGFTPPPPGAPGAVPPPPNGAGTPPNTGATPTAPHGSTPPPPGQPPAPPVNGFAAGNPTPPAPPPPPAPPSPPQRVQAGIDDKGRPYFYKVGNSGEVEY